MASTAGVLVAGPASNDVRPGSLLTAANTPTDPLTRNLPTKYVAIPCSGGWRTFAVDCDATSDGTDTGYGDATDVVTGHPFLIEVARTCATFGWQQEDYVGRVQAHLTQIESAAIAREFWTGELATEAGWTDQTFLAGAGTVDVTPAGGAVSVRAGYARIQQAAAVLLSGEPGAIHLSRRVFGLMDQAGFRREGSNVLDLFDNRVVADAGYPDSGDATGVIYATARPTIRRSPVVVTPATLGEAIDRRVNKITYQANKLAAVTVGCGVVKINVTLT